MGQQIVILGAGPTGLAAAYRLAELGYPDWQLYEREGHVGGLSASQRDEHGFIWDQGGHVMFSRYPYIDKLVEDLLRGDYDELQREAWVWMRDRFIPFPFQNNIHRLPPDLFIDCLMGIIDAQREDRPRRNFAEYITATFGGAIADYFMCPYNTKVWAHPLELLSAEWRNDRIPTVDIRRIVENLVADRDDVAWGPNSRFRFPHQGTGELYERMGKALPKPVNFYRSVAEIDVGARVVSWADGGTTPYDKLVSTLPLTELIRRIPGAPARVVEALEGLHHTSGFFVGVGLAGSANSTKCWVYFPEPGPPFYRVTYLSNYSPHLTPGPDQFSLLAEISASEYKPEDAATIVERTIQGLVETKLLTADQADHRILSRHLMYAPYSYPVPTITRDESLAVIQPWLMGVGIYSRGRFGTWCYETGNADHAVMMGVEVADHLVLGAPETVWRRPVDSSRSLATS